MMITVEADVAVKSTSSEVQTSVPLVMMPVTSVVWLPVVTLTAAPAGGGSGKSTLVPMSKVSAKVMPGVVAIVCSRPNSGSMLILPVSATASASGEVRPLKPLPNQYN